MRDTYANGASLECAVALRGTLSKSRLPTVSLWAPELYSTRYTVVGLGAVGVA